MKTFSDHFSGHAAEYAYYRPKYPPALFDWLATLTSDHSLAWDCGTGNGQAAVELAKRFKFVIATDASPQQIAQAARVPNVEYRAEPAENSPCETQSVELIIVAQALHWFDIPCFFREAHRVLKPGGVIAVFGYRAHRVCTTVDRVLDRFEAFIEPYWPPQRRILEDRYSTIDFPFFEEIAPPDFNLTAKWSFSTHLGYLGTWSAVKAFIAANGEDPLSKYAADFESAWGNGERRVTWDLPLRVGRTGNTREESRKQ